MPANISEAWLNNLADRSFLKLWTLPNTYYARSKELSDLFVSFGDDVVIMSDKAVRFQSDKPVDLAWSRWYRAAVKDSLRQLRTARHRLLTAPGSVFADARASSPVPAPLAAVAGKRIHLVGIARPDPDPAVIPAGWEDLHYVPDDNGRPFHIGPLAVAGQPVHIFDGPTIDLLLRELDTAPDFIAYLTAREARIREGGDYDFFERDLLGAAQIGWDPGSTRLPTLPPLEGAIKGLWEMYDSGPIAARRREADQKSRTIDSYIEITHGEFVAGRMLGEQPAFALHENAMRLIAAESRFARRVIVHELYDLLQEPDQTTFWSSTVPSPTNQRLRYFWLAYPRRPDAMSEAQFDTHINLYLQRHMLVAQALFPEELMLGIALPNRVANDTAMVTLLHDKSNWTDDDRAEALKLRSDEVLGHLEANHRVHIP
jgi:hypothetical protein